MTCVGNTCGTGNYTGPKPGDPDNDISISANVVFGGIRVRWTYPNTNKAAVAFFTVYRSLTSDFIQATELAVVSASSYIDRLDDVVPTQYYYWVAMTTVNGTVYDPIGPASTISVPIGEQTLESLTDRIDKSKLATTLKESIDGITDNNLAIYQEIQDRLNSNQQLADALAAVTGDLDQALTYVLNETNARTDADGAIVEQVNVIAVGLNEAKAAIVELKSVSVSDDEALANTLLIMNGKIDDNEAAIIEERDIRVTENTAIVSDYQALYGRVEDAEGAILNIENLTIDQDSALATSLETLRVNTENAASAVQDLDTALTTGTHALASSVKTVESKINGNVATGEVGLITEVDELTGSINAMWTAKVQVNGLIGGFGIENTGQEVTAGFDVDQFWVGRTGPDAVKPFIISNGVVYINKARIRDADIDTLKIAGDAVTVPITSTTVNNRKPGQGEGTRIKVNTVRMYMPQAGMAYILVTAAQGFLKNDRFWSFEIEIQNSEYSNVKRSVMGRQAESAPVLATTVHLPAGVTTVNVLWQAHPDVLLGDCELFMMGVKK